MEEKGKDGVKKKDERLERRGNTHISEITGHIGAAADVKLTKHLSCTSTLACAVLCVCPDACLQCVGA